MPSRSWEQTLVPGGCTAATQQHTDSQTSSIIQPARRPSIYECSIFVVPDPFVCVHDSKARWVYGNFCRDKYGQLYPTWETGNLCVSQKGEIPTVSVELPLVSTQEALHWHVN